MYCRNCGNEMNDNQTICLSCGVPTGSGNHFCHNCGNQVAEEAIVCVKCGVSLKKPETTQAATGSPVINVVNNVERTTPTGSTVGITKRSLVTAIILSIVTCGIYGIYWYVCLTNEMNILSGRTADANGGTAFLLTLVTCGIYSFIWAYKMGEKRDIIAGEKGSTGIIYLALTFFGLGIVVYALAQDAINKALDRK